MNHTAAAHGRVTRGPRMSHRARNRSAVMFALVVACGITACGSNDPDTTASTSATSGATVESGIAPTTASSATDAATATTGAAAGVRLPDGTELIVTSGTLTDGEPLLAATPFLAGNLSSNLVMTIAYQLVDEGLIDPALTIDQWLPRLPNADRITIAMLINGTHGWNDLYGVDTPYIVEDLERSWTLAEMLATTETNPPQGEPGSAGDYEVGASAMAYIAEQVTGSSLAQLVTERITEPAELSDTFVTDGSNLPDGFQHGVFVLDGDPLDTSLFPGTSYYTYNTAMSSTITTVGDELDLLDVWEDGSLFSTDRRPGPVAFPVETEPNFAGSSVVPFGGYCPCSPSPEGGLEVDAFGRGPNGLGTSGYMLKFSDGISVVVHFNSGEWSDFTQIRAVADAIHTAATEQ
ncbi:MAG: serine hydrolase domain-containing protein [Aeromicrobium sp.]